MVKVIAGYIFLLPQEFTPGNSSSSGNIDVLFIGDELITTPMNLTSSTSNTWSYSWWLSLTLKYVSLTVSGTDLAGNSYSGSDSLTLTIDNVKPLLETLSPTESDGVTNYVLNSSNTITFIASFSEPMSTPQILISEV